MLVINTLLVAVRGRAFFTERRDALLQLVFEDYVSVVQPVLSEVMLGHRSHQVVKNVYSNKFKNKILFL